MPVIVHHNKRKDAHDFLKNHRVGILATVSPDGDPYAAAIYFTVDPSFNVLFLTKTRTKKADNLEHNNHAMLVVYEPSTQTTVQLTGLVSKIDDILETNQVFSDIINASIDTSGDTVPPIAKLDEGDYVAYRLRPNEIRMAVFAHATSGSYKDLFKTIVPKDK
jgi:general stress protein 26